MAFTQHDAGLVTESVATVERLLAEVQAAGQALTGHDSDTIARVYTSVGRFDDAVAVLEPVCAGEANGEDCDGLVMALLTLTEGAYRDLSATATFNQWAGLEVVISGTDGPCRT